MLSKILVYPYSDYTIYGSLFLSPDYSYTYKHDNHVPLSIQMMIDCTPFNDSAIIVA